MYVSCSLFSFILFFLFVLRENLELEEWGVKEDLGEEGGETMIITYCIKNYFSIRKNPTNNQKKSNLRPCFLRTLKTNNKNHHFKNLFGVIKKKSLFGFETMLEHECI